MNCWWKKIPEIQLLTFACFAIIIGISSKSYAALPADTAEVHKLIVYVISPPHEINWRSPASLFRSVKQSYLRKLFHPQRRFMGHMAFCLESSLLPKPLYASIIPSSNKELRRKVLHDKIGFGSLGYGFLAEMESEEMLKKSINFNQKEKRLHYIVYRINKQAAQNIIKFLSGFAKKFNAKFAPNNFYGGSFWPLYQYEGSGCSALCLSAMAVSNLTNNETDTWLVKRKIPMNLVGGELNHNHRVKINAIKKARDWFTRQGRENVDYIDFEIYDPSIVAKWIISKINKRSSGYSITPDLIGLYYDKSNLQPPDDVPIPIKRDHPSIFIKNFYQKAGVPYNEEN